MNSPPISPRMMARVGRRGTFFDDVAVDDGGDGGAVGAAVDDKDVLAADEVLGEESVAVKEDGGDLDFLEEGFDHFVAELLFDVGALDEEEGEALFLMEMLSDDAVEEFLPDVEVDYLTLVDERADLVGRGLRGGVVVDEFHGAL